MYRKDVQVLCCLVMGGVVMAMEMIERGGSPWLHRDFCALFALHSFKRGHFRRNWPMLGEPKVLSLSTTLRYYSMHGLKDAIFSPHLSNLGAHSIA